MAAFESQKQVITCRRTKFESSRDVSVAPWVPLGRKVNYLGKRDRSIHILPSKAQPLVTAVCPYAECAIGARGHVRLQLLDTLPLVNGANSLLLALAKDDDILLFAWRIVSKNSEIDPFLGCSYLDFVLDRDFLPGIAIFLDEAAFDVLPHVFFWRFPPSGTVDKVYNLVFALRLGVDLSCVLRDNIVFDSSHSVHLSCASAGPSPPIFLRSRRGRPGGGPVAIRVYDEFSGKGRYLAAWLDV